MEQPGDPDEDVPRVVRRDERVTPTWFDASAEFVSHEALRHSATTSVSGWRIVGLLGLVLLIVGIPVDFILTYMASDGTFPATMALGFVYGSIVELLAVWGLIRMLTRR